jgi:hypothetical protein
VESYLLGEDTVTLQTKVVVPVVRAAAEEEEDFLVQEALELPAKDATQGRVKMTQAEAVAALRQLVR